MVVAQIAYDRLKPETRRAVDKLVPLGATEQNNTFVTAACWADDLKSEDVHFFDVWHYSDTPIYDGVYPQGKPDGDLLWALAENTRILKSKKASDFERARALRFLIHLVGDAHQPLHCVSRFSPDTPKGDRGGNDFHFLPEDTVFNSSNGYLRNLHSFWDSAGGWLAAPIDRPLSAASKKQIADWAAQANAEAADMKQMAGDGDFYRWVQEGAAIAQREAYNTPINTAPNAAYTANTQRICRMRIAIGGKRLADLLNSCFK